MRRSIQSVAVAIGVLVASALLASAENHARATEPMVVVVPMVLEEHPFKDYLPNATACGVTISGGSETPQEIVTVGEGESETLSCVSLIEAGPLPELDGSIGLIYDFESGPNSVFRGAVILSRDAETGQWFRNESFAGELTTNSDVESLSALRQQLAAQ